MYMVIDGAGPPGRPRKTWLEMVKSDMKGRGQASVDALDRHAWRRKIGGIRPDLDPGLPGAPSGFLTG